MDSYKIEGEAESEMVVSISDASSSEDENSSRNRGGTEPKNKMKLRSFRLSRLPSLRSCVRPMRSPSIKCPSLLSAYPASSEQSTPVVMSDASSNGNEVTSCSDAGNENFQVSFADFFSFFLFYLIKYIRVISIQVVLNQILHLLGRNQKEY